MGKILYPKQRGAVAAPDPPGRHRRPSGGSPAAAAAAAVSVADGGSHFFLNGSSVAIDEEERQQPPPPTASAEAQPNGTVFVSACPVCQQCFRNYVSMSQHCRSEHGLRASDCAFSKYPGKHDPASGPPLEADTVAAHVAHNLCNWLHGKRPHLLAARQRGGDSSSPSCVDDARRQSGGEQDRWAADRPVTSTFVALSRTDSFGDEPACGVAATAAASVAACAGPPVLVKMHDEPLGAAGTWSGSGAAYPTSLSDTPPVLQKCVEHVKPPTFYDEPGVWKFVCLVCHKSFADKSALFAHQRSSHPHVAATHLEVEAGCPPDIRSATGGNLRLAAAAAMPTLRGTRRHVKAEPSYVCVACGRKSRTVYQLHEHILACATSLAPAAAQTATVSARVRRAKEDSAADASLWRYGKSRRYRKHHSSL